MQSATVLFVERAEQFVPAAFGLQCKAKLRHQTLKLSDMSVGGETRVTLICLCVASAV